MLSCPTDFLELQAGAFFYRNLAIASCLKLALSHEEMMRAQEVQQRPKLLRAILRLQGNRLVLAFDKWRAVVLDSRQRPGAKGAVTSTGIESRKIRKRPMCPALDAGQPSCSIWGRF